MNSTFFIDATGNWRLLKKLMIFIVGWITWPGLRWINTLEVKGWEYIQNLPDRNVLFLSNHQTYYTDSMAFYHIFCAQHWNLKKLPFIPYYLLNPRTNMYYIAAEETMLKSGWIPRILAIGGAVTVKRSWRASGQNVQREVDSQALDGVANALKDGWLISFPQGTTSPFAPIRKGTAHMIHEHQPVVIPIVINGFRRAFNKKGLKFKKRGTTLSVTFKQPLDYSPEDSVEDIIENVRLAIEQIPEWVSGDAIK